MSDATGKWLLGEEDESERQLYLYPSLVVISASRIDRMCLDWELESTILVASFQPEIFCNSQTGPQSALISFLLLPPWFEQLAASRDGGGPLMYFSE